jgi:hypothetical protein
MSHGSFFFLKNNIGGERMKKGLVLVFLSAYLLLGPSSKALSPTFGDRTINLSHYTPISTMIVGNENVLLKKLNPLP